MRDDRQILRFEYEIPRALWKTELHASVSPWSLLVCHVYNDNLCSVLFTKCFSEDLGRRCLLSQAQTSRGCECPPSSSSCQGRSDPEPVLIIPFPLPKMFVRCWVSDWGQQAVTEMAYDPGLSFPMCLTEARLGCS